MTILIALCIQTYQNQPLLPLVSREFDQLGGTLGRGLGNDLVLDDPSKYISRVHARLHCQDNGYYFTDVGSNPSLLNERPLERGKPVLLADGDTLHIGEYVVSVRLPVALVKALLPSPLQAPPVAPVLQASAADTLANAAILAVSGGVRNGLGAAPALTGNNAYRGAVSDHGAPENQLFQMPFGVASAALPPTPMAIPDSYDLLADWLPSRPAGAELAAPAGAPALSVASPSSAAVPVPSTAPPLAAAPAPLTDARGVITALLDGLGIPDLATNRSDVELAQLVGAMLREASNGTMSMLLARTMSKREGRLEMTMMASHANNPLKFFPSADMALLQMLGSDHPGYLAPVRAYRQAFDDFKAHELATLAGMRAALQGLLQRFDPSAIEPRLAPPSMLEKISTPHRKAQLWDAFVALHQALTNDAETDFQRLFGEQFGAAYEAQMQRLRPSL